MQHLALVLSLIGITLGGYAVLSAPSGTSAEISDAQMSDLLADLNQLRQDLTTLKGSIGSNDAPLPPTQGYDDDGTNAMEPETASTMAAPMPDDGQMPEMHTEEMPPPDPFMVAQIRRVLREERKQHRAKRTGKHLERFAADLADRLATNEVTTGLSQEERDSLGEILNKERKSLSKLYRGIRSGDLSRKDARQELKDLRADTVSIIRESMGDDVANTVGVLSPLPRRGPLAQDSTTR